MSENLFSSAMGVLKAFNKMQSLYELKAGSCGFGALLPTESATTCMIGVPHTSAGTSPTKPCTSGPIRALIASSSRIMSSNRKRVKED
jgi:hypothetical protein